MNDRLKPYIYKTKGAKNYGFYDMLNGKFYQVEPTGNLEELRKSLFELGLIFKTPGVVPNKMYSRSFHHLKNKINVKNLQIRINGTGENNCWERKKLDQSKTEINEHILERLRTELEYIPVRKIKIEAESDNEVLIKKILKEFKYSQIEIFSKDIDKEQIEYYQSICTQKYCKLISLSDKNEIEKLRLDINNFFYTFNFNPCLGHQIAIDTEGEIKPCLWSETVIGNIKECNLKDLITSGKFDKFWNLKKDKINSCKDCEYRYVCNDCRVSALKDKNDLKAKPSFCKYNPFTGVTET